MDQLYEQMLTRMESVVDQLAGRVIQPQLVETSRLRLPPSEDVVGSK